MSGPGSPLRVDVHGSAKSLRLLPARGVIAPRLVSGAGSWNPDDPAELVIVDLDALGENAVRVLSRVVDPAGPAVVAVSRDPAAAAGSLAAGATDFALLPRDRAWLREASLRECRRRRGSARAAGAERLVVEVPRSGLPFAEFERRVVEHALHRAGWNRSRAARELGISRPRLLRMIDRHALREPEPG